MKHGVNTVSLLLDVGRVIRTRMESELPVPFSQCETLRLLEKDRALTMSAVATHFKIAPPSATAIVNALVEAQLVERLENAADRREVHLQLTEHGKKVLRTVETKRKKIISEILSVLPEKDSKTLDIILAKILAGGNSQS